MDLDNHVKSNHEVVCETCGFKCISQNELVKHKDTHKEPATEQHMCNKCSHSAASLIDLETHVKSNHNQAEQSFKCEKCNFVTASATTLQTHREVHETPQVPNDDLVAENATLKREVQGLTDSYDRLTGMYTSMKEETKKNVGDCMKELLEAQENLRVALAENEKLKETNDIQNNLWKIWIEEHKDKDNATKNDTPSKPSNVEEDAEDTDDDIEDPVTAFLRNRRKGFTRTNPTAPPEPTSGRKSTEARPPPEPQSTSTNKNSDKNGPTNNGPSNKSTSSNSGSSHTGFSNSSSSNIGSANSGSSNRGPANNGATR